MLSSCGKMSDSNPCLCAARMCMEMRAQTVLQSLWVLGQAVVARLPESLVLAEAIVNEALLPTLLAPEPGKGYNGTTLQPSRQNAALALVSVGPAVARAGGECGRELLRALLEMVNVPEEYDGDEDQEEEEYVLHYMKEALRRCVGLDDQ
jgi:hypothetical protein